MSSGLLTRRATVPAFAKINLDLRVLYRRDDGYHELRTIFQTVSLADRIGMTVTRSPQTSVSVSGNAEIPDNLLVRAAHLCLDAMQATAQVEFTLQKEIPMGAGLGGGSSDAAAVLLALPVLVGRGIPLAALIRLAAELGSDVPFFLLGGTAAAVGRGTELYPFADRPGHAGVIVAPRVHVSTANAYRALSAELTSESQQNKMVNFQLCAWRGSVAVEDNAAAGENDFEPVVFRAHPELESVKRRLLKLGARPALMSGSGSAVFGLFRERAGIRRAIQMFREERVFPIKLVSRLKYRSEWRRALRAHITAEKLWPLQSRYSR